MNTRLSAEQRRRMIAQAALKVSADPKGLAGVTHGAVAKRCPIHTSVGTVRHYFSTQIDLQRECVEMNAELRDIAVELGIIE